VSVPQFSDDDFVAEVRQALSDHMLEPASLILEVTESLFVGDRVGLIGRRLQCLRDLGVRIAIDDFGTGYSSLAYLRDLPFDELKIDRAFVRALVDDQGAKAVLRGIVDLCHGLGDKLVSIEGIETAPQAAIAATLGCDLLQGYHFARPLPATEIRSWLDHNVPVLDRPIAHAPSLQLQAI
jgi:EAL domain-containing protein (putative c-di-GMP-specific phosphodiesterase class I)